MSFILAMIPKSKTKTETKTKKNSLLGMTGSRAWGIEITGQGWLKICGRVTWSR